MNKAKLIDDIKNNTAYFQDGDGDKYLMESEVIELINKHLPDNEVSTPKHGSIDALRGSLQNCVNHLERAKRRSSSGVYDNVIEQVNKTLYETLHDNEVSVPVEPSNDSIKAEGIREAVANSDKTYSFSDDTYRAESELLEYAEKLEGKR